MSASEQAAAVRAGELSATELVDAALDAIERLNGEINAVVTVVADLARAEAERMKPGDDRPLAGVPIVIKDLLQLTKGVARRSEPPPRGISSPSSTPRS